MFLGKTTKDSDPRRGTLSLISTAFHITILLGAGVVVLWLLLLDAKVIVAPNISNEEGIALVQFGLSGLVYVAAFFVMKRMLAMHYARYRVVLQSNVIVSNGVPALLNVTWSHATTVWWSFVWRHFLIIACIQWIITLIGLSPSVEKTLWNGLAFGIQYWVVQIILGKKFTSFRILALPVSANQDNPIINQTARAFPSPQVGVMVACICFFGLLIGLYPQQITEKYGAKRQYVHRSFICNQSESDRKINVSTSTGDIMIYAVGSMALGAMVWALRSGRKAGA